MNQHEFMLKPGIWIGEGKIAFAESPATIHFYTKWTFKTSDSNEIECTQQVEMNGVDDPVFNQMQISNITPQGFKIQIDNDSVGRVMGSGILDQKTLGWEFRGNPEFEGFEIYEIQDNGDYLFHAEYASTGQHRTIVDGRVWKKSP